MERSNRNTLFLWLILIFAVFLAESCSGTGDVANDNARPPAPASPSSGNRVNASPTPGDQGQTVMASEGFSPLSVCSLPRNAGSSPFASLGGGKWDKWDEEENGLNFSCTGGTDSQMLEQVVAKIRAGYSALGDAQTVRVVSATYVALQYGGKTKEEEALRPKYAEFCDLLSRNLYGEPLPEKFRKRILDESTYSESANPPDYTEKIGQGLVTLNARKEKSDMVRLEVNFYPTEADHKKFKDS